MSKAAIQTFGGNTRLLEGLWAEKVELLIVGGVAMNFHVPERAFDDLDILVNPTVENATRCLSALGKLGRHGPTPGQLAGSKKQLCLKDHEFYADILTPDPAIDFLAEFATGHDALVNGVLVRICSKSYLRRMKSAGGRKRDAEDLLLLG